MLLTVFRPGLRICGGAQELGLSSFSSERTETKGVALSDGEQWHTLFNTFYKLVFEHIASLVEVRHSQACICSQHYLP